MLNTIYTCREFQYVLNFTFEAFQSWTLIGS